MSAKWYLNTHLPAHHVSHSLLLATATYTPHLSCLIYRIFRSDSCVHVCVCADAIEKEIQDVSPWCLRDADRNILG